MIILIDSNIFINSYRIFEYSNFQRFKKHFPEKNITAFVSEVSIVEILSNYRVKLTTEVSSLKKQIDSVNKLIQNKKESIPETTIEEEFQLYKTYLTSNLKKSKIQVLDYPDISHKEILEYSS